MSVEQHTLSGKREEVNIFLQDAPAGISTVGRPALIRYLYCRAPSLSLPFFGELGRDFDLDACTGSARPASAIPSIAARTNGSLIPGSS